MSDISLPGIELFLAVMAAGALAALAGAVSLGLFGWAHLTGRSELRRRFGLTAAVCGAATIAAIGALILLD